MAPKMKPKMITIDEDSEKILLCCKPNSSKKIRKLIALIDGIDLENSCLIACDKNKINIFKNFEPVSDVENVDIGICNKYGEIEVSGSYSVKIK